MKLKSFITLFLIAIILIPTMASSATAGFDNLSSCEKYLSIPVGDCKGYVSYEYCLTDIIGPNVYVVESNDVYVLDEIKKEILHFRFGKYIGSINLPTCQFGIGYAKMCINKNCLYILDCNGITRIQLVSKRYTFIPLPPNTNEKDTDFIPATFRVNEMYFDKDTLYLRTDDDNYYTITNLTNSFMSVTKEAFISISKMNREVTLTKGNLSTSLCIDFTSDYDFELIGKDAYGNLFVRLIDYELQPTELGWYSIIKYSPAGEVIGRVSIDRGNWLYLPRYAEYVSNEGYLYQLNPCHNEVTINKIYIAGVVALSCVL